MRSDRVIKGKGYIKKKGKGRGGKLARGPEAGGQGDCKKKSTKTKGYREGGRQKGPGKKQIRTERNRRQYSSNRRADRVMKEEGKDGSRSG